MEGKGYGPHGNAMLHQWLLVVSAAAFCAGCEMANCLRCVVSPASANVCDVLVCCHLFHTGWVDRGWS